MSDTTPIPDPSGVPAGEPEVLERGSGSAVPGERPPRNGASRKSIFLVGGTVGALALVGGGVWAAMSFFGTGPQPAVALPSTTLGYASIDLDPSGGQKIAALQTLRKFPAFKSKVGINTSDDLRKDIFGFVQKAGACKDVSFSKDVDPWLGSRAAIAAVDTGGKTPEPVLAVQVKDDTKAEAGLQKLVDCAKASADEESSDMGGFVVSGDWALVARSDAVAHEIADETKQHSLADDSDFTKWTSDAGDSGIVTLYAAPRAGAYLADHFGDEVGGFGGGALEGGGLGLGLDGLLGGVGAATSCSFTSTDGTTTTSHDCQGGFSGYSPGVTAPAVPVVPSAYTPLSDSKPGYRIKDALRSFKGAAAVFRFHDGGFELEGAGGGGLSSLSGTPDLASDKGSDVISTLPDDTAAAIGAGFVDGWFTTYLQHIGTFGGLLGNGDLTSEFTHATGLAPADVETLLGSSAALAVGGDIDPETIENSTDLSQVPIALKVKGDPDQIKAVLAKISAKFGDQAAQVVASDASGDVIAIGPDADFRTQVLGEGSLGDSSTYKDVIEHREGDTSVFFVDVDRFRSAIDKAAGSDQDLIDNLKPLAGVGASSWKDGDVSHFMLRVTTN